MLDQQRKALAFCFFLFCADDPPSGHPLVPGSLRTEEFPSCFVCAKVFGLFTAELGALALFVGVDSRFFCTASGKSFQTCRMHQALLCELLNKFDVNGTPGAGGLARSEANRSEENTSELQSR